MVPARQPPEFYEAVGYVALGPLAVRVDRAEELAAHLRRRPGRGPDAKVLKLLNTNPTTARRVMARMGFRLSASSSGSGPR